MSTPHDLIRAYRRGAKKQFGQHFLSDPSILGRICDIADVQEGDHVIEIGPGPGTLTVTLLERGANVHAFEIDNHAVEFLTEALAKYPNFALSHGDAMAVDFGEVLSPEKRWKCVANLPYNVGTPLFFKLADYHERFDRMALMFQREVARRMVATPESPKEHGVLGLMTQLHFKAKLGMSLPPGAFMPPPKVHSAVVDLRPVPGSRIPDAAVRAEFVRVVKGAFGQRRKTMPNSLGKLGYEKVILRDALESVNIDARARPETLTFEQFVDLATALIERRQK